MSSRRFRKAKRNLKKNIKLFFIFSLLVLIGSGIGYMYFNRDSLFTSSSSIPIKKEEKKKEEKKEPKDYTASLFMVGDALIHSTIYEDARQADGTYNFKPQLEAIKPISSKYDLAYYNQETILGGASLGYSNYPRFNSPTEVGDAFIDAGFNMVSLATNHTMDKNE